MHERKRVWLQVRQAAQRTVGVRRIRHVVGQRTRETRDNGFPCRANDVQFSQRFGIAGMKK